VTFLSDSIPSRIRRSSPEWAMALSIAPDMSRGNNGVSFIPKARLSSSRNTWRNTDIASHTRLLGSYRRNLLTERLSHAWRGLSRCRIQDCDVASDKTAR
jgi:hypothetical protein